MTMGTLTLTDFLLARITEDEAIARRCETGPPIVRALQVGIDHSDGTESGWVEIDAGRVLAECEAKRRIVEQLQRHERLVTANIEKHTEASRGGLDNQEQITALRTHGWELSGRLEALRMAVDSLAAVYADHSDYRDEWRP